jgi:hypothetical protein
MKTPNLLLSGALALVSAASAGAAPITVPAANVLHVVGSTAYRAPFTQSLIDLLSGSNGYGYTYYNPSSASATSVYKASQAVFVGTLNGNPVAIETFWTGSLAGSVDVSVQNKLQGDFLSSTNTLTNAQITTGTPVFDNGTDGSGAAPQVAMSDSFQTSVEPSVFTAPVNGPTFSQAIKSANLVDGGSTANGRYRSLRMGHRGSCLRRHPGRLHQHLAAGCAGVADVSDLGLLADGKRDGCEQVYPARWSQ